MIFLQAIYNYFRYYMPIVHIVGINTATDSVKQRIV